MTDTPSRSATPEPTDPNVIESDTERLHREFGYLLDMYGHRKDESGHWANCRDIINDLARSVPPSEPPALGVDRLVWRLIESYGGGIEIDNVQRFREHIAAALRPSAEDPDREGSE